MTVDHPLFEDWWRHEPPNPHPCWVCGEETEWVYLDIAFQHVDCDEYPTEDGIVKIVGGVQQP